MRARRWILVISLLITFTMLVIYHGWNLFKVNERIKNYVLDQLRPVLGTGIQIQKLDMSLGAVHFKAVSFHTEHFLLRIQDVRIGFNFARLIKHKFRPQQIPHDVLLIQPELIFLRNPLVDRSEPPPDALPVASDQRNFWSKVAALDFLKRITLSQGKISYFDSLRHQQIAIGRDLNGWLNSSDSGIVTARFVGKLFKSDRYNMLLAGHMNVDRQSFDRLDVTIHNFEWRERIPLIVPENINIRQGRINAALSLTQRTNGQKKFDLAGNISLTDGSVHLADKGLYLDDIQLRARLKDNDFLIEAAECHLNGSKVIIAGQLHNIFDPIMDLTLSADEFDWQKNLRFLAPNSSVRLRGKSQFVLKATDPLVSPVLNGQLWSRQISLNGVQFQDLHAKVLFDRFGLKLEELKLNQNGWEMVGQGCLNFTDSLPRLAFTLFCHGSLPLPAEPLQLHSLQKNESHMMIEASGDFSEFSGKLTGQLALGAQPNLPLHLRGGFRLANQRLIFQLGCSQLPCQVEAVISFAEKHPKLHAQLTDIHRLLDRVPALKWVQKMVNVKNSSLQIQHEGSAWKIGGKFIWPETARRLAELNCRINSHNDQMQITADVAVESNGERFHGNLSLSKTSDQWQLRHLGLDEMFSAEAQIDLTGQKRVNGELRIPDLWLPKFARLISRNGARVNEGRVRGKVSLAGQMNQIELVGKIDFSRIKISRIGYYDGAIAFRLADRVLRVTELVVDRNDVEIFRGYGQYSFASKQLEFDCHADGIDLENLSTLAFNRSGFIAGKGQFQIELNGDWRRPIWWGTMHVSDGKLGPFGFTRAQFELGPTDSIASSGSQQSSGLVFRNIFISRAGQFEVHGNGRIPFSELEPMNIDLQGQGNILALLPDLTPFFKKTASDARWSITLGGRPNDLMISQAKIDLSHGYLRLEAVAPEIHQIAASMELEQDGFLNVKSISGKIKGREFTIRNMRPDSLISDGPVTPFTIPEYGLSFGVFAIETSPKGIPLHIPGFMEKGEMGQFAFRGKTDRVPFLIAGPLEQPLVKGKITLNNVNFTFPFLVSETEDTTKVNPVVELLTQINWNVTALVGKDAHYQRQIPSGVDRVYVDLILDAGVGGLEFKGVIKDKTFGVTGVLESSRGNIEYLDLDFEVVKAGAEFDMDVSAKGDVEFDKSSLLPIVYGEGRTTVTDSTGYPYYIYLTLLTVDQKTGQTLKRGRLGDVVFQLSADNPNLGYSEGELLASLGYSLANMQKVATDIIGISADNLIFRPLFRPFERQLERTLGLDIVRFSSRLTRNLIEMNLNNEQSWLYDSRLFLLRSTKLILGKYLAQRLFLLYTGQLEAGMHYRYEQEGLGLHHTLGLEYRINPNLLLEMQYDYNSLLLWQKEDKRIMLRHSFPF